MVRPGYILLLCLLYVGAAFAQNERAGGFAAEATYKWKLPRAWVISAGPGLEARPYFGSEDPEASAPATLRNFDLNAAVVRRWLEHWRFGSAVRLRSRYPFGGGDEDGERARELRTWLYAEFITDSRYFRWAHRFRTEQRFRGDAGEPLAPTYRHRYRVGFEHALAGQTVDPEEWFMTASAEVLVSTDGFAERPTAIDVRPSVTVGKGRFEFGLEFRGEHTVPAADSRESHALLGILQVSL